MSDYSDFLNTKSHLGGDFGFEPSWMPDCLFDFQRSLVEWACRKGRAAIFADCGLGKGVMQLVWAENVVRESRGRVLILAPIAVGAQTVREATKFGIEAEQSRDGKLPDTQIVVANYERLHLFNPEDFDGVVCDESSILKNFDGKRRAAVTEFLRNRPYRLLCTATAAPNDYVELGTSAEALSHMGYHDMLSMFFKQDTQKDHLGWGRTKYRMRAHAETHFWKWVCSWARACRKPSDLGFDNGRFELPALTTRETVVKACRPAAGMLFEVAAETLQEQREEQRRTLTERCEAAAVLITNREPGVAWCQLNDESKLLTKLIPGATEVSGDQDDEEKEERLVAFSNGDANARVLVTKPKISGFGLNWQHCNRMSFFPSHSFEQYYQAVRRCWRFGQSRPVTVNVVTTEGGAGVLSNLNRKAEQADAMFANLVALMHQGQSIGRREYGNTKEQVPSWLVATTESRGITGLVKNAENEAWRTSISSFMPTM